MAVSVAMVAEVRTGSLVLGSLFHAAMDGFNMERALGASLIATGILVDGFHLAVAAERRVRKQWRCA